MAGVRLSVHGHVRTSPQTMEDVRLMFSLGDALRMHFHIPRGKFRQLQPVPHWKNDERRETSVCYNFFRENFLIDPRVQHFMEKLKRMQAAIREARNYKNPSRDFIWVNSLG